MKCVDLEKYHHFQVIECKGSTPSLWWEMIQFDYPPGN